MVEITASVSLVQTPSVEVMESRRPLLAQRFEFAIDSAGSGEYRGEVGIDVHSPARADRCLLRYPDGIATESMARRDYPHAFEAVA
jgi:N-methylhydantoinase B/oxoprolinase/acetone carboxylase alpha subunit